MTVETCLNFAVAAGALYAGLEFGRECWYGSVVANGTTGDVDDNCKLPCGGNGLQYCGSSGHLLMYAAANAPAAPPSQPPVVAGASWYGCMTETITPRTLAGMNFNSGTMKLATCASFCASYNYFGVE